MRNMSFMPELKEFLKKNGRIYTVRKYDMTSAIVDISGVGECKRVRLGPVTEVDLVPYVNQSGFNAIEDWLAVIYGKFIARGQALYLYEVTMKGVDW